ncbi:MAG: 16S rRNA (adenine(1518)-N(6)/adenine(1519)-N(6))-dimethyltransferase RsmA [Brumimicrobium sp.]
MSVDPKKHLGQHFLVDENISRKIVDQFSGHEGCSTVLEIGPGMGAITKYFLEDDSIELHVMEVDRESVAYLTRNFPQLKERIHQKNFLKTDFSIIFGSSPFAVVGNFPYNISSQILFKCIQYRNQIPEIMGMFQKELVERISAPPGTKQYGVLNVLLQTYYDIEYCFTVEPTVFNPPPKVKSGVIRCLRNERKSLQVDEQLYEKIVKTTFSQRRKTIRNTLKSIVDVNELPDHPYLSLRPERLSIEHFIELTGLVTSLEK